jgi:hypothetical protein
MCDSYTCEYRSKSRGADAKEQIGAGTSRTKAVVELLAA